MNRTCFFRGGERRKLLRGWHCPFCLCQRLGCRLLLPGTLGPGLDGLRHQPGKASVVIPAIRDSGRHTHRSAQLTLPLSDSKPAIECVTPTCAPARSCRRYPPAARPPPPPRPASAYHTGFSCSLRRGVTAYLLLLLDPHLLLVDHGGRELLELLPLLPAHAQTPDTSHRLS